MLDSIRFVVEFGGLRLDCTWLPRLEYNTKRVTFGLDRVPFEVSFSHAGSSLFGGPAGCGLAGNGLWADQSPAIQALTYDQVIEDRLPNGLVRRIGPFLKLRMEVIEAIYLAVLARVPEDLRPSWAALIAADAVGARTFNDRKKEDSEEFLRAVIPFWRSAAAGLTGGTSYAPDGSLVASYSITDPASALLKFEADFRRVVGRPYRDEDALGFETLAARCPIPAVADPTLVEVAAGV